MNIAKLMQAYELYGANRRIVKPYLCIENSFYMELAKGVTGYKKLPILDNPADKKYTPLKTHEPMSEWRGIVHSDIRISMYDEISRLTAKYLSNYGLIFSAAEIDNYKYELCALYLICTGAVIQKYIGKGSGAKTILMTKCTDVLLDVKISKRSMPTFQSTCTVFNKDEIMSGRIRAVAFELDASGIKNPRSEIFNLYKRGGSVITSLMCLLQYDNIFSNALKRNTVRLGFIDLENNQQRIVTTLNPQVLNPYVSRVDMRGIGELYPENITVMPLIDLANGIRRVDVPITNIVSMQPESGK